MSAEIIPIDLGFVKSFLIKDKKTILVDTGIPGSHEKILSEMKKHGINPSDLSMIIITHAHTDHFGSIEILKKISNCIVAIHKEDSEYFIRGINQKIVSHGFTSFIILQLIKLLNKFQKPINTPKPDIIIENELSLNEFGVNGKIFYTPGHTPGSISVLVENNIVIAGDTLVGKTKPKLAQFAYNMSEVKKSIKKIIGLNPEQIYTSHGGSFNKEQLIKLLN